MNLAPHTVSQRFGGGSIAATLRAAQQFGVWDLIETGRWTPDELAKATGLRPAEARALLTTLTSLGVIRRLEDHWMSVKTFDAISGASHRR
jgi:DNA-binding IclR family transcriptional regulator